MKDDTKKKLKSALAVMRKAAGMNQSELARKMKMTQEYACRLEGNGPMSIDKAIFWAKACGYKTKIVFKAIKPEATAEESRLVVVKLSE